MFKNVTVRVTEFKVTLLSEKSMTLFSIVFREFVRSKELSLIFLISKSTMMTDSTRLFRRMPCLMHQKCGQNCG